MGNLYKENKNLFNKFCSLLDKELCFRPEVSLYVDSNPIGGVVFSIGLRLRLGLGSKVSVEEANNGKRAFFCITLKEISATREIEGVRGSMNNEDLAAYLIRREIENNTWYPSESEKKFLKLVVDYLVDKRKMTKIGANDISSLKDDLNSNDDKTRDDADRLLRKLVISEAVINAGVMDDMPEFKEILRFISDMLSCEIEIKRYSKVFASAHLDSSLFPLGYFDAEDYTINVPERKHNSSNYASTSHYGKFKVQDDNSINGNTKYNSKRGTINLSKLAEYAAYNMAVSDWLSFDIKGTNNFDRKSFEQRYLTK